MGNPVWPAAKSRAREGGAPETKHARVAWEGGSGTGSGRALGLETEEEKAYRLHVVRRLPGLVTLDCADITEEERTRAKVNVSLIVLIDAFFVIFVYVCTYVHTYVLFIESEGRKF